MLNARTRIFAYFFIVIIVASALFSAITYRYEKSFENATERYYSSKYQKALITYIDSSLKHINSINKDWAIWNDSYNFMTTKSKIFIKNNYPGDTLRDLDIDYMLYFTKNRMFFGVNRQDKPITKNPLHFIPKGNACGFIEINSKPYLYSSNFILPSDSQGKPKGTLVILKEFSISPLKDTIKSLSFAKIPKHYSISTYKNIKFATATAKNTHLIIFFDINNNPVVALSFIPSSNLLSKLHGFIIFKTSVLMLLFMIASGIFMYFIVHYFILHKINKLTESIKTITHDFTYKKPYFNDKDFDKLADVIEILSEKIKNSEYIFNTMADIIPAGIVIYNDKILYANKYAKEILQTKHIVGKNTIDIFYDNNKPMIQKAIIRRKAGEKFEARYMLNLNLPAKKMVYLVSTSINYKGQNAGLSTFIDVTEIHNLKEKYKRIIENLPLGVIHKIVTIQDNTITGEEILYVSPDMKQITGYENDEIAYLNKWINHVVDEIDLSKMQEFIKKGKIEFEVRFRKKDGNIIYIKDTAIIIDKNENNYEILALIEDITKRKKNEILYKTIYQINNIIVKSQNEYELLKSICKCLYENGFIFVWIGYEQNSNIKHIAKCGEDNDYLENIYITTIENHPNSLGPTGLAHKLKSIQINPNTSENDNMTPFKKEMLKRNFLSSVAVPIVINGKTAYSINIYSDIVNFFDSDFKELFSQLSMDISFAIQHLRQKKQLYYELYYDGLTKLKNMVSLKKDIKELNRCTLLYFRIKNLSTINQIYGIQFSDNILKAAMDKLETLTKNDYELYRLYGNKFALLKHEEMPNEQILHMISIIKDRFESFTYRNRNISLYIDVGVSKYPSLIPEKDNLIESAETALTKARQSGKVEFYSTSIKYEIEKHFKIEHYLKQAIENEDFFFYYQPILNLQTNTINKCEALIRLKDKNGNFMNPEEFISIAERVNLIDKITALVIKKVFKETSALKDIDVAINISAKDIERDEFISEFKEGIEKYRKETGFAGNISIEITERDVIQNIKSVKKLTNELKALGANLEIDDFGIGYSSLDRLIEIDFDTLKIDKTLIDLINANNKAEKIIIHIIQLAHSLNAKVLAEGVETEQQLNFLKINQCDYIQGYYISRPLPFNQFKEFINTFNNS